MSRFGDKGRRCDYCGRISKNRLGEYTRRDASGSFSGYIWPEENELPDGKPGRHICDDCTDKRLKEFMSAHVASR